MRSAGPHVPIISRLKKLFVKESVFLGCATSIPKVTDCVDLNHISS